MKKFSLSIILLFVFVSSHFALPQNENSKINYQKGVNLHKQGKTEEAIKALDEAIKADKDYLDALFERGACKYDLKDYRGAEGDMNKCLKINGRHAQSYYYIGLCYLKAEYPTLASEYFTNAIVCDTTNYLYYYYRGVAICELKSDYKFAFSDFKKALKLNPNHIDSYIYLGNIAFKFKEYQKSIENNQKVISLDPKNAVAYFNTGIAYNALKDYPKACSFLKTASDMGYASAIELIDKVCNKIPEAK